MQKFIDLSPVEGAKFYATNRGKYNFLDSIYGNTILPIIKDCNYYELREIALLLKNTPFYESATRLYELSKKQYVLSISKEIQANCNLEKETFNKAILPSIEMDIDSMLEKDMKEILSKYSGGILNYRKLSFFFGRDKNDFKKMFWDKFDENKYIQHISKHIQAYLDLTSEKQNSFCKTITGLEFNEPMNISYPKLVVGLSKSSIKHVAKYTLGEKDEIVQDVLENWVAPIAIGAVSGGLGTIYDISSMAYDVKVSMDEVKAEKIDPDDMVRYVCANDISYQIKNFFLNICTTKVKKALNKSNKQLLNTITIGL
jgi:hypothetical protein